MVSLDKQLSHARAAGTPTALDSISTFLKDTPSSVEYCHHCPGESDTVFWSSVIAVCCVHSALSWKVLGW